MRFALFALLLSSCIAQEHILLCNTMKECYEEAKLKCQTVKNNTGHISIMAVKPTLVDVNPTTYVIYFGFTCPTKGIF